MSAYDFYSRVVKNRKRTSESSSFIIKHVAGKHKDIADKRLLGNVENGDSDVCNSFRMRRKPTQIETLN